MLLRQDTHIRHPLVHRSCDYASLESVLQVLIATGCKSLVLLSPGFPVLNHPTISLAYLSDQFSILDITEDELSAIGIREKGKRSFMTTAGKKWPSGEGEGEFAALAEDTLIVRARRSEIENLRALLKLHRAGYKIPKIGSNQADKK